MKKVLLASTALLAFATVAQAAEPVKLGIGGYMTENFGYASNKDNIIGAGQNANGVDVQSDVNVNFVGATKLDNGINVAVEVDTFGSQRKDSRNVVGGKNTSASGNGNVKRSYLTVSGAFGAVIAGEREDALYIVHNSAPDVGNIGLQDGTWFQWVLDPSYHRTYNTTNTARYDNRTNKISYVTPSFYGLAAAASYVPNASLSNSGHTTVPSSADNIAYQSNGLVNGTDLSGDVYGAGLAYANKFGDVSIKADAGYAKANAASLNLYQGGLQVSYAGFTVGGSYLNRNVDSSARLNNGTIIGAAAGTANLGNAALKSYAYAGQSWDIGASYTTGPYAVSLGYFHDSSKNDVRAADPAYGVTAGQAAVGGADSTNVVTLSGAYTMGPGVVWQNSVAWVSYNDGAGISAANHENDGVAVVTGMKVTF